MEKRMSSESLMDFEERERDAPESIKQELGTLRDQATDNNWTFTVGYTPAMDFEIEEITGLKLPEDWQAEAKKLKIEVQADKEAQQKFLGKCRATAAAFNWADHNGVTDVKSQEMCGSCWVFSTHGAFEASYAILNKAMIDSAEQDTLDCSGLGDCGGGGWAFDYLIKKGSAKEADYPYTAKKGTCKTGVQRPYKAKAWGYVDETVEIPSVDAIKKALCMYGPLVVAVRATNAMKAYTGGVFNENAAGPVNHGVVLVGWEDSRKAWRMRNSWSKNWGELGYMWITYTSNQIGYAAAWTQAERRPKPKP